MKPSPYKKYKVLCTVTHKQTNSTQKCLLSDEISARNIHECLKKLIRKKSFIPSAYNVPWYEVNPATIYIVDSNIFYTFVEGFWRQCWGVKFEN